MSLRKQRRRADVVLHELGMAPSRERARALILAGRVFVGDKRVEKPGEALALHVEPRVTGDPNPYASRGGLKLHHALERFPVSPQGLRCLDAGASTGGFTDCLLQHGARHVVAVDVGHGQLVWKLQNDDRVTRLDKTNARELKPEQIGEAPGLVTGDLSFISLTKVLPALTTCAPEADFITLVKPQFEAGRERIGKGGVVRDPRVWLETLALVADCFVQLGFEVKGATASPLRGPAGNREFFLHASPGVSGEDSLEPMLAAAVAEAESAESGEGVSSEPSEEPVG